MNEDEIPWAPDDMPEGATDITPDESVAPVYETAEASDDVPPDVPLIIDVRAEQEEAVADLVGLGISDARARIIVGIQPAVVIQGEGE